jgi:hypothetical protein
MPPLARPGSAICAARTAAIAGEPQKGRAAPLAAGHAVGSLSLAQDVAFVVDTFDRFGNRRHVGGADLRVAVSGPSHVAPPTAHVRDNADGSYSVRYAPRAPGLHRVGVTVGSAHIQGSEFDVEVRQDAAASAPGFGSASCCCLRRCAARMRGRATHTARG